MSDDAPEPDAAAIRRPSGHWDGLEHGQIINPASDPKTIAMMLRDGVIRLRPDGRYEVATMSDDDERVPGAGWVKLVERHKSMALYVVPGLEVRKVTQSLRDLASRLDLLAPTPETAIEQLRTDL